MTTERKLQKRQKALEKACDKSYYKMKLSKKDWIIMVAMTIIYTLIAFIYLGTTATPQTYWTAEKKWETFVIDLGEEVHISRINFYCGVSGMDDSTEKLQMRIMYKNTETDMYERMYKDYKGEIQELAYLNLNACQFKIVSMEPKYDSDVKTRYLKFITQKSGLELGEIGIFVDDSKTAWENITVIEQTNISEESGSVEALFDEPQSVPYSYDVYNSTYFDEIYHGVTAYDYIMKNRPSEWTHPPLGKLLIAGGMLIFGKNMFGMRAMGTIFGILLVPLMYIFGKKVTKDSWGGFAAAFLMMFDFMHFTHSRISSIDVYGVTFVLLMFYFMYDFYVSRPQNLGLKKSFALLLASGFFMGCAISVKWNMAYGAVGLAIIFAIAVFEQMWHRKLIMDNGLEDQNIWTKTFITDNIVKTGIFCVFAFIVLPVTLYFLTFIPYTQVVNGTAYTFKDIINLQGNIYKFHGSDVVEYRHWYEAAWYTWPVTGRPLYMYASADNVNITIGNTTDTLRGTIVTMGNPAIWWVGVACVIISLAIALKKNDRRMLPVFIAIFVQYIPWMLVDRCTYIYHYFPILPFVMLCIAYVVVYVKNNIPHGKKAIGAYFAVVALLFVMFFPALTGLRVPSSYIEFLKWFPSWSF